MAVVSTASATGVGLATSVFGLIVLITHIRQAENFRDIVAGTDVLLLQFKPNGLWQGTNELGLEIIITGHSSSSISAAAAHPQFSHTMPQLCWRHVVGLLHVVQQVTNLIARMLHRDRLANEFLGGGRKVGLCLQGVGVVVTSDDGVPIVLQLLVQTLVETGECSRPRPMKIVLAFLKLGECDEAEMFSIVIPCMNGDLQADGFGDSADGGKFAFEGVFGFSGERFRREATRGSEVPIIRLTTTIHGCLDGSIGSKV